MGKLWPLWLVLIVLVVGAALGAAFGVRLGGP